MLKTQTKPTRRLETVLEFVTTGGRIDHKAGIIRDVKILGKISKNRREYTDAALEEAAGHYRGVKVNLNHPSRQEIKSNRGIQDWVGSLENVVVRDGGVFGDLHLLRSHPYSPAILEAAEKYPSRFGLSHNADVVGFYAGGKAIIESVEKVRSVDLVQSPATTGGLFESVSVLEMDGMADFGAAPTMGPGPDAQADDAEPDDADAAEMSTTASDVAVVVDDAEMTVDEKLAAIKAILTAAESQSVTVEESYSGRRSSARSALEFDDAKSFADLVRGPATSHRPSTRKSSRSYSLVEQVQGTVDPKSALKFTDAKSFASQVR